MLPVRLAYLFDAQTCPELAFDLFVIKPPLPLHEVVVIGARQKADGNLEAASLSPAAAVKAPHLRSAERLLQERIRIERRLLRTQASDDHFAPVFNNQPVDNSRVDVLFGQQKVRGLWDG